MLESLRVSGGNDRSSTPIYELKGRLSGTATSERILAEHPEASLKICDLNTCYIKALYLPGLSTPQQLQDFTNRVRKTFDISHTCAIPSRHVLVIRGTSEQVAAAESLPLQASAPQ